MTPRYEAQDFFGSLKSFSEFSDVTEDSHYETAPDDWCVVISDVKGSTEAIESGRYKDVNTIGAAAIVVVQNALEGREVPYVFGGDGATLMVPGECREPVIEKLVALKKLALQNFDIDLRVGIVDVSEIHGAGHLIEVAKYEISSGRCVAIFRGGGLTYAENLVKDSPERFEIAGDNSGEADLSGLSCRWNAIPNRNGCIISLLAVAHGENAPQIYKELFKALDSILAAQEANPVNTELMSYRSFDECIQDEKRFHQGRFSVAWFRRFLEIMGAVIIFKRMIFPVFSKTKRYADAFHTHSDYRKFDDMLRMILDCSPSRFEELETYLQQAHQRGELSYGLHRSDTSLMTCYVHGIGEGEHLHFIDGGDGGYAMAAKQLKAQLKSLAERK